MGIAISCTGKTLVLGGYWYLLVGRGRHHISLLLTYMSYYQTQCLAQSRCSIHWMDGWKGKKDRQMASRMGGWMDGWIEGRKKRNKISHPYELVKNGTLNRLMKGEQASVLYARSSYEAEATQTEMHRRSQSHISARAQCTGINQSQPDICLLGSVWISPFEQQSKTGCSLLWRKTAQKSSVNKAGYQAIKSTCVCLKKKKQKYVCQSVEG